MFFKQVKYRGDNFSYLIADEGSGEASIVDPSYNAEAIILILKGQKFRLKYIINTHGHADHTAGNEKLKKTFHSKIVMHKLSHTNLDISVVDGDVIRLGSVAVKVIHTPGHSPDSICLLTDSKLLTGDTLFVGRCGRTDFYGGSPKEMYVSLLRKLAMLDGNIEVYPGHDYGESRSSTIAEEKLTNPSMQERTLEQFILFIQTRHSVLNSVVSSIVSQLLDDPVINRLVERLFLWTQRYSQ